METANATVAPTSSFWEDLIDIFFQPAAVFRRREGKSAWPPLLFVAIAVGIVTYATFNSLQPIFDAEFSRNAAKAIAQNPQAAQAMGTMRGAMGTGIKYGAGPTTLLVAFVLGVIAWLVGKVMGGSWNFQAGVAVAAWAYMPRVVGALLGGVQGLLMDPTKLNSQMSISIGPARFFNPDTTNPVVLQLLGRLDLMTLWVTALLAVGFYVVGKVPKGRAALFGVVMWVLGALPALRQAMAMM